MKAVNEKPTRDFDGHPLTSSHHTVEERPTLSMHDLEGDDYVEEEVTASKRPSASVLLRPPRMDQPTWLDPEAFYNPQRQNGRGFDHDVNRDAAIAMCLEVCERFGLPIVSYENAVNATRRGVVQAKKLASQKARKQAEVDEASARAALAKLKMQRAKPRLNRRKPRQPEIVPNTPCNSLNTLAP